MNIDEYRADELADRYAFLDDIDACGSKNMRGDLERTYRMPPRDARDVLTSWFATKDPWKTPMERARDAISLMRAD